MIDLYNHKTADGLTPIIMLEDSHLLNIIRMHLRNIENARLLLEQKDKPLNTVASALYRNQPQIDPSQMISKAHETLMPYVLEAVLRGLTDSFAVQMQDAYGYKLQQKAIETKSEPIPF
jgi:hypothetical protein